LIPDLRSGVHSSKPVDVYAVFTWFWRPSEIRSSKQSDVQAGSADSQTLSGNLHKRIFRYQGAKVA
jgi:hypothetical protein